MASPFLLGSEKMSDSPLNFHRAEYGGDTVSLGQCPWCGRGLEKQFYLANNVMICSVCAARAILVAPANTSRVCWRSVAWGTATAIGVSLVLFLADWILLTWVHGVAAGFLIALASLSSGYAIGKTMRYAAKGAGGRRYQIAASVLTYCCLTIALSANLMTMVRMPTPLWALPFLTLTPLIWPFVGRSQEAGLILTMAFIGIRWAWMLLKPWPFKITGPEFLPSSSQTSAEQMIPDA